jgi:hypothetical protein
VGIDECLSGVNTRVTPAMNDLLSAVFSPDEVNLAGPLTNAATEVPGPGWFWSELLPETLAYYWGRG